MANEISEAIRNMKQMEGWIYVEKYIQSRVNYHKEQLLHCDVEKVMEHRNKIEALKGIDVHLEEIQNEE